ncbi:MAG TPA: response regulator [Thermoguttaceae bacterium]|nr:response regulator [Thermoguttaceae bacterium]
MRILVAEDDCISAEILANALQEFGYEVTTTENGREAFDLVRTGKFRLVVSDWEMPGMSGVELCRQIRQRQWSGYIYVILITSHTGVKNVVRGLEAGADDFLTKPFHPHEVRVRLRAGERVLSLESRDLMIFALAKLAESRDVHTGAHLERMREYCRIVADEISHWEKFRDQVDGEYVELLYLTSPLHDIGKVGIPDSVLLKPGRLTAEEFEVMKQHAVIGGRTIEAAVRAHPEAQFLTLAREIAMTHHERFDGGGYPCGLAGEEIPLCGRVSALADVYDSLTSQRVYKRAFSHEEARSIILEGRGTQFDPDMVEAFLRREEDFLAIYRRFGAAGSEDVAEETSLAALAEPVGI